MLYDKRWEKQKPEIKIQPWQKALLDAADLIETEGWTQGAYHRPFGMELPSHCMVGAIRCASLYNIHFQNEVYHIAIRLVRNYLGIKNLEEWNDAAGRTSMDVIQVLREVATRVL